MFTLWERVFKTADSKRRSGKFIHKFDDITQLQTYANDIENKSDYYFQELTEDGWVSYELGNLEESLLSIALGEAGISRRLQVNLNVSPAGEVSVNDEDYNVVLNVRNNLDGVESVSSRLV